MFSFVTSHKPWREILATLSSKTMNFDFIAPRLTLAICELLCEKLLMASCRPRLNRFESTASVNSPLRRQIRNLSMARGPSC